MKKTILMLLTVVAAGLLAACQKAPSTSAVYQHTTAVLAQSDQVWREVQTATATQTASASLGSETAQAASQLSPWVTDAGKFYHGAAQSQTTYQAVKAGVSKVKNPNPKIKTKWATVKQINRTLKTLGATKQITSRNDLVYIKEADGSIAQSPVGYLIQGDALYAVQMAYTTGETGGVINRGNKFTRKMAYASDQVVKPAAISGTWQTKAGQTAVVKNGQLFAAQNGAYTRGQIENLGQYSTKTLYTKIAYQLRQTQLSKAQVKLSHQSLASGDVYNNLYVFLTPTKMVAVNAAGQAVLYTKQKANQTSLPSAVFTIFSQLDKRSSSTLAGSLRPQGEHQYLVGLTVNLHFITQNYAGGVNGTEPVTISKGKINVNSVSALTSTPKIALPTLAGTASFG